jgi:hypothetical protein
MSLDVDFYNKLVTTSSLPVQQNTISESKGEPRVWFGRQLQNKDLLANGSVALVNTTYDVEVTGLDIDVVEQKADAVKAAFHGFQGTMGSTKVLASFVNDANDDYIYKSLNGDEGFHSAAFSVQILT